MPDSSLFRCFLLGLTFESLKELGVCQKDPRTSNVETQVQVDVSIMIVREGIKARMITKV
jgi:hypothetical protein